MRARCAGIGPRSLPALRRAAGSSGTGGTRSSMPVRPHRSPPPGGVMLVWRNWMLRILENAYWLGTFTGTAVMLVCGGFVPVGQRWLLNEIGGWSEVVETLGGVWFPVITNDPDSDLGPVVARVDAPLLFDDDRFGWPPTGRETPGAGAADLSSLLRRGGLGPLACPVDRIAALPGAHPGRASGDRGARARAPGPGRRDAGRSVRPVSSRASSGPSSKTGRKVWGPLGAWARLCLREAARLIEPVSRGQEARADRCAAAIAGGGAASSALVKVAIVQPLFREVLSAYDPTETSESNLYAFFRSFWYRLPADFHSAMRLNVLAS